MAAVAAGGESEFPWDLSGRSCTEPESEGCGGCGTEADVAALVAAGGHGPVLLQPVDGPFARSTLLRSSTGLRRSRVAARGMAFVRTGGLDLL